MKAECFEDLAAWTKARELVNWIFAVTKKWNSLPALVIAVLLALLFK
jgi:hypothetical protein